MGGEKGKTEAAQNAGRQVYLGVFCLEQEAKHRLTGSGRGQKAEGLISCLCGRQISVTGGLFPVNRMKRGSMP